jgi:hypothetical protein
MATKLETIPVLDGGTESILKLCEEKVSLLEYKIWEI